MSYNDFSFELVFSPLLRTREQISVVMDITIGANGNAFHLALLNPFASIDPIAEKIRRDLQGRSESIVSQWALQFSHADAALDRTAYDSLTRDLSRMSSDLFALRRAVVRTIVPVSAPLPVPPPPPPPKAPEPTASQSAVDHLKSTVEGLGMFMNFAAESQEAHSKVWSDPESGELLKAEVWRQKRSFLLKNGRS